MIYLSEKIQSKASLGEDEQHSSFPATGFFSVCWNFGSQLCSVWVFNLQKALKLFLSLKTKDCSLYYFSPDEGGAMQVFKNKHLGGTTSC